jgi:hypothetical protein
MPELGDWSSYIDKLEPYRDGRAGERIGVYVRSLLESFGRGRCRDEAMRYADRLHMERWGKDKVLVLKDDIK